MHIDAKWQCLKCDRARFSYFSGQKCRKYAGKTFFFLAFSRDFIVSFFSFFAQRCILIMPKIWPSSVFEKFFFRSRIPEICRKSPFLQISIRLFPYISLFFHTKTLLITLPTIKHVSIVNKTEFWSRNYLKILGTADFRRKKTVFLEFLELYFIFFHEILKTYVKWHTDAKWQTLKYEWVRFWKTFFSAENGGNMPEKPVFWHFLEI